MRSGLFMMPLHPPDRPLAETAAEDADKIVLADQLGLEEAWVGEHFSAASEPLASPLMFLASVLPRTRRIRFGTGVIGLGYHHPAIVAAEAAQFDQMSRGRLILGIGAGGLASDAELFGHPDPKLRGERMQEAIDMILALWAGDPPYRLEGRHWQIRLEDAVMPNYGVGFFQKPFQKPHPPIALSVVSPHSVAMKAAALRRWIAVSANFIPTWSLITHWPKYCEGCAEAGRPPDPSAWRVARNVIVADTDAEARDHAFDPQGASWYYFDYLWQLLYRRGLGAGMKPDPAMADREVTPATLIEEMVVHGSPATVAAKLLALRERIGPFGTLLLAALDWSGVNAARERRSLTLFAERVLPKLRTALGATAAA
ncbi:MAG: LLM class flavin-dependent oxidoreductase [Rhodospirillales bacterium]|nr:LLM class flavin-dependent oxidoreductase [Rhodospirillales bacterium]